MYCTLSQVLLVREKETAKLFALKIISKDYLNSFKEVEHTRSERNILENLTSLSHPFLMRMHHSFQTRTELYMVLDYHYGGDIATQLAKLQTMDENRVRFYAAEIVLGIEELHKRGIIYRCVIHIHTMIDHKCSIGI
jgi:serine/threonine protein kinase